MTVVINELEVVAAPTAPAVPGAAPPNAPEVAAPPGGAPTARDVKLVVRHHLERLDRVSPR